jgi:hypothetical protein
MSFRFSYGTNYEWKATYEVEHGILHGDFFEHHLVFRECACLIGQQVLDPPQLFGDRGIPRNRARYLGVSEDTVGIVDLGHIQVDSQGDGDDVGEEEDEAEELDDPLALEVVQGHHEEAEEDHAEEEEFGELVELQVELAYLGRVLSCIHV